ncbi:hypothetical protein X801_03271, partial [Opisthorchis viverrini]
IPCVLLLTLIQCILSTNYDAYIDRLATESEALRREFVRSNPRGQYVLEKLRSPGYRSRHPILSETSDDMYGISLDDWRAFLQELRHAKAEAARPLEEDEKISEPQLRWYGPEHYGEEGITLNEREPASRRNEVAYQNHLWGEQKVSGGSGEIGQWLDFALLGAQLQDEDEEDENNSSMFPIDFIKDPTRFMETKNSSLPAYCDPPNPCPIGYDPENLSTPCDPHVVYSMDFNRDWILTKQANGEYSQGQPVFAWSKEKASRGKEGILSKGKVPKIFMHLNDEGNAIYDKNKSNYRSLVRFHDTYGDEHGTMGILHSVSEINQSRSLIRDFHSGKAEQTTLCKCDQACNWSTIACEFSLKEA